MPLVFTLWLPFRSCADGYILKYHFVFDDVDDYFTEVNIDTFYMFFIRLSVVQIVCWDKN